MALLIDKGYYVKEQIVSGGKGTIMSGLNSSIIKDVWVGLPELGIQKRITAYLDEQTAKIDRLMDMRRRQMALLKEQRAALIQQAVTRGLNPNAPMKDSGLPWLGEIPAHWDQTLNYLASLLRGGNSSSSRRNRARSIRLLKSPKHSRRPLHSRTMTCMIVHRGF